jgi:hypothetical protein
MIYPTEFTNPLDDPTSIHVHVYINKEEGKVKLFDIVNNAVSHMGFKEENIVVHTINYFCSSFELKIFL